jgi:hypothetical protein
MTARVSDQEIFDRTLKLMRVQGMRAERGHSCVYSMPDPDNEGKTVHCAVGIHLLPEDLKQMAEDGALGYSVTAGSLEEPLDNALGLGFNMESGSLGEENRRTQGLLIALQGCHDNYMPLQRGLDMSGWESEMAATAREFGLAYAFPEEVAA